MHGATHTHSMIKFNLSPNVLHLVSTFYAGIKDLERIEKANFYCALTYKEKEEFCQASLKDTQMLKEYKKFRLDDNGLVDPETVQ